MRAEHMISFIALSATVVTFKKIYLVCECVCVWGGAHYGMCAKVRRQFVGVISGLP